MKNLINELIKYKQKGGQYNRLAESLGISKSKLSKILHGERRLTTTELIKLAKILNCDINYLTEE